MHLLISIFIALYFAACALPMATPKVQVYQSYPPTNSVEVWQTTKPNEPYKEIGRIEVGDTDDSYSMNMILKEAKKMGADGVIIIGRAGTQAVAIPIGTMVYAESGSYGIVAIAIKYTSKISEPNLRPDTSAYPNTATEEVKN